MIPGGVQLNANKTFNPQIIRKIKKYLIRIFHRDFFNKLFSFLNLTSKIYHPLTRLIESNVLSIIIEVVASIQFEFRVNSYLL